MIEKHKLFDAHFHIIDYSYPLVSNNSYLPAEFNCLDYMAIAKKLNIVGGAIVSGSFQAFDQSYLKAALKILGPGFVGVTQLPASTSDAEILALNDCGVRAIRFNLKRGGSENIEHLESFAKRVYELVSWHVELYVDSMFLPELSPILIKLPAVSIDHLGLSQKGLPTLLHLAEQGIKVKATGFGRVDFDVAQALTDFSAANPDALMFGTDLPSTRAPKPFSDKDINLITETLDYKLAEKVLYLNAMNFYKVYL